MTTRQPPRPGPARHLGGATRRYALAGRIAAACLALLLTACTAEPARSEAGPDLGHLLRMQIAVEWDGVRMDIDETIYCGHRKEGTLEAAPTQKPWTSHYTVTRPTHDGGLLRFPVSWVMCSIGQSVWRPGVTEEKEYKAPPDFVPAFLWVNSPDKEKQVYGELYASEASWTAPAGRLRILSPMRFSIPEHPPSPEAVAQAFRNQDREHRIWWEAGGLYIGPDNFVVIIPESEWGAVEEIQAKLDAGRRSKRRADPKRMALLLGRVLINRGVWFRWPIGHG